MENNSTLEEVLLVCYRNDSCYGDFSQKDEEEKLDNSEKFAVNKFAIFSFICLSFGDI